MPPRRERRLAQFCADESGAAILEFALLLPILLTLVFGCFELGRALLVRQVLEGAVRGGARTLALVPDPTCEPACSPGAAHAVSLTLDEIRANTRLAPETIAVQPSADLAAGTVAMTATVGFRVELLGPAAFKAWTLSARHQERRVAQ